MSLLSKAAKFAKTPQGKKLTAQAMNVAKDPKTKQQIAGLRARIAKKG